MVILEAFFVFSGWDYGIFNSAIIDCIYIWYTVLFCGICDHGLYLCQGAALWGSSSGVALHDVYYFPDWRSTTSMSWHYGAVYEQVVYGSEGQTQIPC